MGPVRPAVAAAAGVGFASAAVALGATASLWSDEGDTWTTSATSTSYFVDAITGWDSFAPLYFALVRAVAVVGDDELVLRFPSIVAGVVAVLLTGRLSEVLAGPRARYVGVLLGATNALLLHHASEARSYALTMALGAWSTLALLRATSDGSRRRWARYALATSLLVLSHVVATTLVVAHAAWLAIDARRTGRRPPREAWAAGAVVGVVCALMGVLLLRVADAETEFEPLTVRSPVVLARDVFGNGSWLPLLPASAAFLLGARAALGRSGPHEEAGAGAPPSSRLLVVLTATVPLVLLLLGSLAAPSSLAGARYASAVVPAALAVVAAGVLGLAGRWQVALLAVTVAASVAAQVRTATHREFEDVESAMALVRDPSGGTSAVVYFDPYVAWVASYYLRDVAADDRPEPLVPGRAFPAPLRLDQPIIPTEELAEAAAAAPDLLWLVQRPREASARIDDYRAFRSTLEGAGYEPTRTRRFEGVEVIELRRG